MQGEGNLGENVETFCKKYVCLFSRFSSCFFYQREGSSSKTLPDIPSTAATEINYLIDREIITGYEDGTFKPTRNVTRAEAAIMLGKALRFRRYSNNHFI